MNHPEYNMHSQSFTDWLHVGPRDGIVGASKEPEGCPIACYLRGSHPREKVFIEATFLIIGTTVYATPGWVREFIRVIDRGRFDRTITAEEAITALTESQR